MIFSARSISCGSTASIRQYQIRFVASQVMNTIAIPIKIPMIGSNSGYQKHVVPDGKCAEHAGAGQLAGEEAAIEMLNTSISK